jgi:hypothetical protein
MLRKHINMTPLEKLGALPFYCWDCITLLLPKRCGDANLVIKSETNMRLVIKFLIYQLKTIDGHKNTALGILDALNKQEVKADKAI